MSAAPAPRMRGFGVLRELMWSRRRWGEPLVPTGGLGGDCFRRRTYRAVSYPIVPAGWDVAVRFWGFCRKLSHRRPPDVSRGDRSRHFERTATASPAGMARGRVCTGAATRRSESVWSNIRRGQRSQPACLCSIVGVRLGNGPHERRASVDHLRLASPFSDVPYRTDGRFPSLPGERHLTFQVRQCSKIPYKLRRTVC
jgi:hypothetical protein